MNLFSGITFLNLGLLLGLLPPILILAYLFQQKFKHQKVSSVIVLKTLPRRTALLTNIKLPLRFFLEFLALIAIVLAIAMPVIIDRSDSGAIVLDNTLSMQAVDTMVRLDSEGSLSRV